MNIFYKAKFLILLFLVTSCQSPLEPKAVAKLKENHTFWTWQSKYGPLNVHYIEKGAGSKHIFLVHGFGAHSYTWRNIIDPLANAGYHVWSIDLIGSGLSDKPDHVPYGLELFLDQIHSFLIAKNIPNATFIGNSMGGGVSLGMALTYPNLINGLILIDALGYPINLPPYLSLSKSFGALGQPLMGRWMIKWVLEYVMYNPSKITEEQVDAYLYPHRMPGGDKSFIKLLQSFDNEQLIEMNRRYPSIKVPMLIIWGEEDRLIPINYFHQFAKDFPDAKTVVIPHCGHIPQEECPEEVNKAILNFLK